MACLFSSFSLSYFLSISCFSSRFPSLQDIAQHSPLLKVRAFEDALKRRYLDFCSVLERGASDEMEYYRSKVRV